MKSHPDPETLVAYHADSLDPDSADAVQEHLADCRTCVALLLDIDTFVDPPSHGDTTDLETAGAWRAFRVSRSAPPRRVLPIAASVLLALIGFGWALQQRSTIDSLRRQIHQLQQPRPGVAIVDLFPESVPRAAAETGAAPTLTLPATLIVHLPQRIAGSCLIEMVDASNRPLWTAEATPDSEGVLSLDLPAGFIDPGFYRLRVDAMPSLPSESFPFVVVADP